MAVHVKSLDAPEATEEYDGDGVAEAVQIGDSVVWRSRLRPGWSWERNAKPRVGADFCPAWHREYVVAGRILYRLEDGSSVEGKAGDYLVIEPGHAAEVLGDEECVLLDWYGADPDAEAHAGHDH
ncbi:MAG TPA: hypothetical protein VNT28_08025 [Candidatus Limnocylindrales bacterium]|jgi:hypothetical protein|nr:hypothetical protein [Candidatus Limnocylindrales bacterium]